MALQQDISDRTNPRHRLILFQFRFDAIILLLLLLLHYCCCCMANKVQRFFLLKQPIY